MNSIGRLGLLLAAGVTLLSLALTSTAIAGCPSGTTLNASGYCVPPYVPGKVYSCNGLCDYCAATKGRECVSCLKKLSCLEFQPHPPGSATGTLKPSQPSDETKKKSYCQYNLVQSQLRPFETRCEKNPGGQSHCSVNTSKVPNDYDCCCTYSEL